MLSTILTTLLAVAPSMVAATAVPRQDDSYSFTMYQSTDCSGASEGTISNSDNSFAMCSSTLSHSLGSVMVSSNAHGRCTISFYDQSNHDNCMNNIANQPNFQVGTCFEFTSTRPTYYGVACHV